MPRKKYGLHCFCCGLQFSSKKDVCRIEGDPYCICCWGNYHQSQASMEVYDYEMKKWEDEHPGVDYDEYMRKQAYINKYGEC